MELKKIKNNNKYLVHDKRIPRATIEKFIVQKKLHNVVGFLDYVAQRNHLKELLNFIRLRDFGVLPGNITPHFLFHGSSQHHNQLTAISPSKRRVKEIKKLLIYATSDPNYAIFLALLRLKNASASVVSRNGRTKLAVDLAFVNRLSSLGPGWVHLVSGGNFKKILNNEYVSVKPVEVLFAFPVVPSDLTVPINIEMK